MLVLSVLRPVSGPQYRQNEHWERPGRFVRLPSVTAMAEPGVWAPELEVLYRDRYDRMVRVAYLVCGDRAAAEEITQDAFVATHQAWDRVREPAAYLRTTVVNRCRSWGRRHQLERTRLLPDPEPIELVADEMWDALRTLPDRQRTAIVLRFYEDLPDIDIAEILGCREATVRTAIHRALKALRKEIQPDG
jgi:RNA polymerase sigma-70 factor (sigma-E family)